MNRSFRLFCGTLACLAISGCAFSAVKRPNPALYSRTIKTTEPLEVSKAEAMDAARRALKLAGYEIQADDTQLGIIRTKSAQVPIPAICDCGTWNLDPVTGMADSYFEAVVEPVDASHSLLKLTFFCGATFTGHNLYGAVTRQETYQCASRGEAEKNLWQMIDRVLRSSEAKP